MAISLLASGSGVKKQTETNAILPRVANGISSTSQTSKDTEKNTGGILGGIAYLHEKVGLQALSGIEGIWDYTAGGIAKIFGADDWAESQFDNDWVNYGHADEWYNPDEGWSFAGDVAGGIGSSLPTIAAAVGGAVATYYSGGAAAPAAIKLVAATLPSAVAGLGAAGNATKEAYRETGELGAKEFGYGALVGGTEAAIEKVTAGIGTGSGRIISSIAKRSAGELTETLAKSGAKNVLKTLGQDFVSEAFEEGIAEILSPVYQRMTYNPDAENASMQEVAYAALVGGLSGALMSGANVTVNTSQNLISGNKVVSEGKASAVLENARQITERETTYETGYESFKNVANTYNQLSASLAGTNGEVTTVKQKMLLGQLTRENAVATLSPFVERSAENIIRNIDTVVERYNALGMKDANGNPVTFTKEQILSGIDLNADRKTYAKQLRKALSGNSVLATLSVADATGNLVMDTRRFAEMALDGKNLASRADYENFRQNATAEEKAAVGSALGIENFDLVKADDFRAAVEQFAADGKMSTWSEQSKRISAAERISADSAKPLPHILNKNMTDGVRRYTSQDGSVNMAIIKEGTEYRIYNYDTHYISRALTKTEVNKVLRDVRQSAVSQTSEVMGETQKRYAVSDNKKAAIVIEADSELARRIESSSRSKHLVIRDYLVENFYGQEFVLSDGRKAIMDKSDAQKLASNASTGRTAQLGNLRKIVETAQHSHSDMNVEHNKFSAFHYYAIDVTLGKDTFKLWINVGVAKNDGTNHIYAITNRTEEAPTHYGVTGPVGNRLQNASSTNSIPQTGEKVNTNSKNNKRSDSPILSNPRKSVDQTVSRTTTSDGSAPTHYGVSRPVGYAIQNDSSINSIPENAEKVNSNSENNSEEVAEGFSEVVSETEKITVGMSEGERADILRNKRISPAPISESTDFDMDSEALETKDWEIAKKLKKPIVQKLRELGFLKNYKTEAIDVDFEFTGNGALKSANSQILDYGGSLGDFAKVVMNLQVILDRAVLLEIHNDKAVGTSKENSRLLQTYVLLGAFQEGNFCTPVQFEIKQYTDNKNRLYLAVALTKIETGVVSDTAPQGEGRTRLLPVSDYSIAELIQKVNTVDENFFKYIPDEFLTPEQLEAKHRALAKEAKKYGRTVVTEAISKTEKTTRKEGTVTVKADESTLTERQKISVECLRSLAKAIGVNFVVEKLSTRTKTGRIGENGRFDHKTNTVYLDLDAGNDGEVQSALPTGDPEGNSGKQENLREIRAKVTSERLGARRDQRASEANADFDAYARDTIKDYNKLAAPNQAEIRAMIREGRALGIEENFLLSCVRVSARSGLNVVFSKEQSFVAANGTYADGAIDLENNRIIINPEAKSRSGERILLHELTHAIYKKGGVLTAAKGVETMTDAEKEAITKRYRKAGLGDTATLVDEINAHFAEQTLSNKNILDRLVQKEPSVKEKILAFFKGAKSDYAGDAKLTGAAAKLYRQYKKLFDQFAQQNAQNIAAERMPGVTDSEKKTPHGETPNAGARYAINAAFASELDEWAKEDMPSKESFILGETGNVLQGLGAIESDIYMRGDKIKKILGEHPEITLSEIKKIPQILENPTLILKSRNVERDNKSNTRLVIFGTYKAQNGLPIMAVLDMRPVENHLVIDGMQKVVSSYTKTTEGVSFVRNSDVMYADKEKTAKLLRSIGFQMPIELNKSGFIGSISYSGRKVNLNGEKFSNVFLENSSKKHFALPDDADPVSLELTQLAKDMIAEEVERDYDADIERAKAEDANGKYHPSLEKRTVPRTDKERAEYHLAREKERSDRKIEAAQKNAEKQIAFEKERADYKIAVEKRRAVYTASRASYRGKSNANALKIQQGMTDLERYKILKHRKMKLDAIVDSKKLEEVKEKYGITERGIEDARLADKKRLLSKIGEEFGVLKRSYYNSDIQLEFTFSKGGMNESVQKQGKQYSKIASMLTCFDKIVENAIGVEVHNRNSEGYKTDNSLKNVFVLASAFVDGEEIVPVKLEVKEFSDKKNTLYVAIALESIKTDGIVKQEVANTGVAQQYSPPSNISIAEYFRKINPSDESFYKYIPKPFIEAASDNHFALPEDTESVEATAEFTEELKAGLVEESEREYDADIKRAKAKDAKGKYHPSLEKGTVPRTDKERAEYWKTKSKETESRSKVLGNISVLARKMKDLKLGTYHNATQDQSKQFAESVEALSKIVWNGNLSVKLARKHIGALRKWYKQDNAILCYENKDNPGYYNAEIAEMLAGIADADDDTPLSVADLRTIRDIMQYFIKLDETYNKVFKNGKWIDAEPEAKRYIGTINANKPLKVGFLAQRGCQIYMETFSEPLTVARRMDYYARGGFYTETLLSLREAAVNADVTEMEVKADYDAFMRRNKKYLAKATEETMTYRGTAVPRMQLIGLYMTFKRKQAQAGLVINGFYFRDKNGETVRVPGTHPEFGQKKDLTQKDISKAAEAELASIGKLLTKTDKEYIGILEKAFNEDARKLKADTDMQRLGYTNAHLDYYYPIRRGDIAKNIDASTFFDEMNRVSNASYNKDTVRGARQKLFIESADSVFNRHVHSVCLYASLSPVIDAYNRIYNLDVSGNPGDPNSVKTASENTWKNGSRYIAKLVADIQGVPASSSEGQKLLGFIRSGYAQYQLGANPKTWVSQISSIFASSSLLDADAITRGMGISAKGIDEYCPLAKLRNNDNTVAKTQGLLERVNKVSGALMARIGEVDRFVICRLFGACQAQVEKNGGAKVGTEENKIAAGKLLREVILETQQNSAATEKSAAMRSGSEIMRTVTMFSADSMKVLGRVIDSVGEVSVLKAKLKRKDLDAKTRTALENDLKAAHRKARKSVGALMLSSLYMVAIARLFRFLYAKEDDDENAAVSLITDFVGNLFGGLPVLRDVVSFFTEGYEVDNYAYSALNDLLSSAKGLFDAFGSIVSGDASPQDITSGVKRMMYAVGQLFGIPVRNIYNMTYGLTKRFSPETAYKIDMAFYEKNYQNDLYKAVENGDEDMVNIIMGILYGERISDTVPEEVHGELYALSLSGYKVIPRSIPSTVTYNGEELTLTEEDREAVKEVYSGSLAALTKLFGKARYRKLTEEQRAEAINYVYDTYYKIALKDTLGVDRLSGVQRVADVIGVEALALLHLATKDLESDVDRYGNTIQGSKRKKVIAAINSLGLSAEKKLLLICMKGYSIQDGDIRGVTAEKAKRHLLKYILSMRGKTRAEKAELAELCGFTVKNGKIVTKAVS